MNRSKKVLIVGSSIALAVLWFQRRPSGSSSDTSSSWAATGQRTATPVVPADTVTAAGETTTTETTTKGTAVPGQQNEGPTKPPVDADEERQRLLDDAAQHGVNQADALELAETVAQGQPLPDAYRAVDRRLATGHSLEEAEEILLGDVSQPSDDAPAEDDGPAPPPPPNP